MMLGTPWLSQFRNRSNNVQVRVLITYSSLVFITTRLDSVPSTTNDGCGQRTLWISTTGAQKKGFMGARYAMVDDIKLPHFIFLGK